ncbi:MAG: electron transport complex subunit RsxC [Clostridia bacterium]|nr:electron transport complex subunit RsxC [Clostridia bacterium]
MFEKLLGKLRIPHLKSTASCEPVVMDAPSEVIFPTLQHRGKPAIPVVKATDTVKVGQLIAEADGKMSSPIYSSVSGKVTKIDLHLGADGRKYPSIRIESDGLMTVCEDIKPPVVEDLDTLIEAIHASGIIGLGGAGFPTAVKLEGVKNNKLETVIINGAECEPYLTCDARMMLDNPELIFEGVELLKKYLPDTPRFIFGIETNKPECIETVARVFADDESVSVMPLPTLYPQGAEKVLIYNTLGITVPENKLPIELGVMVMNVTTLALIAKYVKDGMPLTSRCVTLDGSAVKEPKNVIVPIGAKVRDVIEFAGGLKCEAAKIILGGPMTGVSIYSDEEPVIKTTGGIIALSKKDALANKSTACIHCGRCTEACPQLLDPTSFGRAAKLDNVDDKMQLLDESRINLCVECGSCSFVCPANRPILENIRTMKASLREYKAHKAGLK